MAVHKFSVPSEVEQFKSVTLECDDEAVDRYLGVVTGKCHLTLLSGETIVMPVKVSVEALLQLIEFGFPPNTSMTAVEVNPIYTTSHGPRI